MIFIIKRPNTVAWKVDSEIIGKSIPDKYYSYEI